MTPRPPASCILTAKSGDTTASIAAARIGAERFSELIERYGLETVSLRIGSSFPEPADRRMLATWLSYDDLERLVLAALTAPVVDHTVVYGMSDNRLVWWDNSSASHLGYRPQDSSEPFRAAIETRQGAIDPTQPAARFQGGAFVTKGPF